MLERALRQEAGSNKVICYLDNFLFAGLWCMGQSSLLLAVFKCLALELGDLLAEVKTGGPNVVPIYPF